MIRSVFAAITLSYGLSAVSSAETFKVFILAGQSNMVGQVQDGLLEHQATNAKTADLFSHLRKDGKWITRDDVFIKYEKKHGGLTKAYGSRGQRTGLELEYGTRLGDHYKQPVLLIKTCWGGHSLFQKFRSPSAGLPSEEFLQKELSNAIKRTKQNNEKRKRNDPLPTMEDIQAVYGSSYRMMMKEVQDTLAKYETLFPELKGKTPEISGFVWFQGWNDQYNGAELEYASNMKHFINDVRKDLKSPKLPFVIGVMGQNGSTPAKGAMKTIQEAQLAMEKMPEFKGNVTAVRTDVLVDKAAEKLYPDWKARFEEWKKVGSDRGYHYYGSAIWFNRIGKAFAEATIKLEHVTGS
ncbi:sialate O-acetylesterase [Oceaniferula spumae]